MLGTNLAILFDFQTNGTNFVDMINKLVTLLTIAILLVSCGGRGSKVNSDSVSAAAGVDTIAVPETKTEAIPNPEEGEAKVEETLEKLSNMSEDPQMPIEPAPKAGPVKIGDVLELDKTVHDFGDFLVSAGPQKCTFTIKNISSEPISILEVITSCGCTDAEWTREAIGPGQKGTISSTYKNEDGPIPFDKTLTVYLSNPKKPLLLRLRGVVHEKPVSLDEAFSAYRVGPFGMKGDTFKVGNMEQGESRSDQTPVANLGGAPITVSFRDVSKDLSLSLSENPIPPGKVATLTYTVRSDREKWGRNEYYATPVVGGKAGKKLTFWAITKENFASWTEEQKDAASKPIFDESTYSFGVIKQGVPVEAKFEFTNKGKSPFKCYKADSDFPVNISPIPELGPGETGSFTVSFETTNMQKGEVTVLISLTTNSPLRPIINLFVVGDLK